MQAEQQFDIVVVGARVAGAVVAATLGDAGVRTLLVDRDSFPSPAISTHFFRGAGMVGVLQALGVLEEVLETGCPPLVRQYVYPPGVSQPVVSPPQKPGEVGYALSVQRETLDQILVQRAAGCATVEFREQTRVSGLVWDGDRVCGVRLIGPDGEATVRARLVVGADGKNSFVARAVAAPLEREDPSIRAIYYCYVPAFPSPEGSAPDGPEFSFDGNEILYAFPSDHATTCLAVSVDPERFHWMRKALHPRFRERLAAHPGLAPRVIDLLDGSEAILGSGLRKSYVRVPVGPGWALVGDASLHQDPWTGYGMDLAGTHARFLGQQVAVWLDGSLSEAEALHRYHAYRNETGLPLYTETYEQGLDLRQLFAG